MKLNYKRTIYVGFAFFLICAFWQAYDNTIPLILTNKFGLSQTFSGVVMALDNILALFMLPLFGAISDKFHHRLGRRTPFILIGTVIAAAALVGLAFMDLAQLRNIKTVSSIDDAEAIIEIYQSEKDAQLQTPEGEKFILGEKFTQQEFSLISSQLIFDGETDVSTPTGDTVKLGTMLTLKDFGSLPSKLFLTGDFALNLREEGETLVDDVLKEPALSQMHTNLVMSSGGLQAYTVTNGKTGQKYPLAGRFTADEIKIVLSHKADKEFPNPQYTNYLVPARQAYAWNTTANSTAPLAFFMILLLVVLISMSIFRSPAVALMPDVTIKPLRSKANAIINLMGSAGGIVVLALGMVFATSAVKNSMMSYVGYFAVIAGIMLAALAVFRKKVDEPAFVAEMAEESRRCGIEEAEEDGSGEKRKLTAPERKSLIFLLASIVLWFMGYNAVTSKYSVYASNILHKDYNLTLIIAQAAAIIAYLPVGFVASKIGRKKTIFAGIIMLTAAFFVACFLRENSPSLLMNVMFALAGIGWATINVNSFPMVVELCQGGDVGKYTGFYYTASMAAQTVTPMISGALMDKLGMTTLFPYATIFVALAFVTMFFVMHGDNKPAMKTGLEALDVED